MSMGKNRRWRDGSQELVTAGVKVNKIMEIAVTVTLLQRPQYPEDCLKMRRRKCFGDGPCAVTFPFAYFPWAAWLTRS